MGRTKAMTKESGKIQRREVGRDVVYQAVREGIQKALEMIRERFEDSEHLELRLAYHNRPHTQDVIRRTMLILSVLREVGLIKSRDVWLGCFAAAFHDSVQEGELVEVTEGNQRNTIRKRPIGENENKSADAAVVCMRDHNHRHGHEIFSKEDEQNVRSAIEVTMTQFDPTFNTATQPKLTKHSSFIARALALADLGTAGMDGPKQFIRDGNTFFQEENYDIGKDIENIRKLSEEKKQYIRKRMIAWSEFQPQFAQGRKDCLVEELEGFPPEVRGKVVALFSLFDQSIQATKDLAEKRKKMSFEELVKNFEYHITQNKGRG